MKKIFIRTETSVSSSWADSLETLNTYYDGDASVGIERPDVSKIKDCHMKIELESDAAKIIEESFVNENV